MTPEVRSQPPLAQVWHGVVCSHCGGRYGRPLGELAERCLDCGKVGYESREQWERRRG